MRPLILFDLDGTLIDSTEAILESFDYAFRAHGTATPAAEAITPHIGHTLEDIFVALGVDTAEADRYVASYKEHYRTVANAKTVLLPYAAEAVRTAATFADLAVVTTKTGRYSRELLDHLGLLKQFEVVIGREDVVMPKPHAEPILAAVKTVRGTVFRPETVWMIGDTILDLESAKNAGVSGLGVLSGYGGADDLARYGMPIFDDARAAVAHIGACLGL